MCEQLMDGDVHEMDKLYGNLKHYNIFTMFKMEN